MMIDQDCNFIQLSALAIAIVRELTFMNNCRNTSCPFSPAQPENIQ